MTEYEALAETIKQKRQYREEEDGTIYCSIRGCTGSGGLRCYRTGVPICQKCAVRTPVGYISKEAARSQQDTFFDAEKSDYALAGITAFFSNLFVGLIATQISMLVISFLSFFGIVLMFFIATSAAGFISEAVWRVLRKKRGRYTRQVVMAAILVSSVILLPFAGLIVTLIYTGIVIVTVNARFQIGLRL